MLLARATLTHHPNHFFTDVVVLPIYIHYYYMHIIHMCNQLKQYHWQLQGQGGQPKMDILHKMPCHVNCQYFSSVDYLYDFQRSLRQKDCLSVGIFHYIFGLGCCAGGNEGERKDWGRSHSSTRWALLPPALLFSCYATQPTTLLGWWRTVKVKIAPLLVIL